MNIYQILKGGPGSGVYERHPRGDAGDAGEAKFRGMDARDRPEGLKHGGSPSMDDYNHNRAASIDWYAKNTKVGDFVQFKNDFEQSSRVLEIRSGSRYGGGKEYVVMSHPYGEDRDADVPKVKHTIGADEIFGWSKGKG